MRKALTGVLVMMMLGLGSVASAMPFGDDEKSKETEPASTSDEGGLLAGPKVDEEPDEADNPAFGGEERARRTVEIPAGRWFMVLQDIELTDEQRAEASAIAAEYQEASRQFRIENKEAMDELQAQIEKARATSNADPKLRERYRDLQSKAPPAKPYQDRIWSLLDETQQEEFKARLEEVRKEIAARRADERENRIDTMRRGAPGEDAMDMGEGGGTAGEDAREPTARRGEGGPRAMRRGQGLDAMSQKRFEFLMSKRSKNAPQRPGLERLRERDRANRDAPPQDMNDDGGENSTND